MLIYNMSQFHTPRENPENIKQISSIVERLGNNRPLHKEVL